jgi:hypothetical protein
MKRSPAKAKAAFSLVEVVIALGVAVFCLLTLVALLPVGVTANKNMVEQTVATGLMAAVVDDLRNTPAPTAANDPTYGTASINSPYYQIPIPRATGPSKTYTLFLGDNGALSGTFNSPAVATATPTPTYRVQLDFYPPGATTTSTTPVGPTRVRILVTWPALADPGVTTSPSSAATAPKNFTGSVETVVSLNRNWLDH